MEQSRDNLASTALVIKPTIAEATAWCADYKSVPVYTTLPAATRDPLELFKVLKKLSKHCYIFESLEDPDQWGRYTFLGYDPKLELTCIDGALQIKSGTTIKIQTSNPGQYISQLLADYTSPSLPELPPFTGGLVGYFAYDYIKYSEPRLALHSDDQEGFKDVDLMLFDKVIAYDHLKHQIILISTVQTENFAENYHKAAHDLETMTRLVQTGQPLAVQALKLTSDFEPLFSQQQFCKMVDTAKNYIKEGDIFQVVLSNRQVAQAEGSLFDTYRVLRDINPSPYMFYFSSDDVEIAGASPETLAKLQDGQVFTFPLAGTKPRGATPALDAQLESELLADEKELAEHNMLVDMGRNDVGKVSRFGSVEVERYLDVLRFSHVMHIGSTVSGTISAEKNALDVIDAILPAGTLSGAPKIRACEIIHELENNKRGIYGGAIGYLAFTGNMDTCIAIRLAFKKNGKVFVRSGAGIVADSVPETEYAECRNKIQAVIEALHVAEGGYVGQGDVPDGDVPDGDGAKLASEPFANLAPSPSGTLANLAPSPSGTFDFWENPQTEGGSSWFY